MRPKGTRVWVLWTGLAVVLSAWAHAQVRPRPKAQPPVREERFAVSVGGGFVKPEDIGGTVGLSTGLRYRVTGRTFAQIEVGYWKKTEGKLTSVSNSELSLGGTLVWRFPATRQVYAFLGGGVGLHRLKTTVEFGGAQASQTDTRGGVHLLNGVDVSLGRRLSAFAIGRFDVVSDLSQFKIYGGLRYGF